MNQPTNEAPKKDNAFGATQTIIALGTMGIAFTFLFTEWWPVDVINDFQADIMNNEYYPALTFLCIWLPLCFPLLWISKLISKKRKENNQS